MTGRKMMNLAFSRKQKSLQSIIYFSNMQMKLILNWTGENW